MHVFIDESGTFASTRERGSYSVVAAYVVSERDRACAEAALRRFKLRAKKSVFDEVKARDVSEEDYLFFLEQISLIDGIVVAVVADGSMHGDIARHKELQAKVIDDYVPVMINAGGKEMVAKAAADVRRLSNQNYAEFHCRAQLVWDVIRLGSLYFVQRQPATLSRFRWTFDAKDVQRNHFESTMSNLIGTICQSISQRKQMIRLVGADYSRFDRFEQKGADVSWFPASGRGEVVQVKGLLYYEHMTFVDSAGCPGVQIADLVVNGLARCLRGRFHDGDRAAKLLGKLMLRCPGRLPSIEFVMFSEQAQEQVLPEREARLVRLMYDNARSMIAS